MKDTIPSGGRKVRLSIGRNCQRIKNEGAYIPAFFCCPCGGSSFDFCLAPILLYQREWSSHRDKYEATERKIQGDVRLYKRFTGNTELILAAYNAGPGRVAESNMTVPRINETLPYIKGVKQYYDKLKAPVETRRRGEDSKALLR